jgi:hypothetical protein
MDQLAEYRARQKQKWAEAERLKEEAEAAAQVHSEAASPPVAQKEGSRIQAARPCALVVENLQAESRTLSREHCPGTPPGHRDRHKQRFAVPAPQAEVESSCPGTPREYRARQQQRFASVKRLQQDESGGYTATSSTTSASSIGSSLPLSVAQASSSQAAPQAVVSAPEGQAVAASSSSHASPPTPRLRGSASLRAISAARAMRSEAAMPLPGAAWPGHAQEERRPQSASRSPPNMPPRPPSSASSSQGSPSSAQPSNDRRSRGLPPRPHTPSSRAGETMNVLTCVAERTGERTLTLGSILCH